MKVVISAGHGLKVRGAVGPPPWGLDEVNEARKMVPEIATNLRSFGVDVVEFYEDTATTQDQNLKNIVNFHNSQTRNLDISVHFNAYTTTAGPRGTECLYITQKGLADRVAQAIAEVSGLINRGAKERQDLYFLRHTTEPAILIETCFVDSQADVTAYHKYFDAICMAIAEVYAKPPVYEWKGLVSWFGGPEDSGVAPDEGLAFIYEIDDQPSIFLPTQPAHTSGLARRLDPDENYIALRWDYVKTPREMLLEQKALVRSPKTGKEFYAYPADWGPHVDTGRVADISPGLMEALGIDTDDEVEVTFPHDTGKT